VPESYYWQNSKATECLVMGIYSNHLQYKAVI